MFSPTIFLVITFSGFAIILAMIGWAIWNERTRCFHCGEKISWTLKHLADDARFIHGKYICNRCYNTRYF